MAAKKPLGQDCVALVVEDKVGENFMHFVIKK